MSARGLLGNRVEARRAGMMTVKAPKNFLSDEVSEDFDDAREGGILVFKFFDSTQKRNKCSNKIAWTLQ